IMFLQYLLTEIRLEQTTFMVFIVALSTRLYIHTKEARDFDKQTEDYNLKFKQYEDQMETYKNQKVDYEKDLKQYQIIKQRNESLKMEKTEIQEQLNGLYAILGANFSSLSPKEKGLYIQGAINTEPIVGSVNRG